MSRARRGGALRALVVGALIAFVVAYGGCLAYEATLRTDLDELRAELEAGGAALDLGDFADTLERGDPRTAEFLRSGPSLPQGDDEARAAFEARLAALGPLDMRGEIEQALDRAEQNGSSYPVLVFPWREYSDLVQSINNELMAAAIAGDATAFEPRAALTARTIELVDGDALLIGFAVRSAMEQQLFETLETGIGLLPASADLASIEAHLTGLEPRARLRSALEGERAYGLALIQSLNHEVLPDMAFGGDLKRLQIERDYFLAMADFFGLMDLSWTELQLERRRRDDRRTLVQEVRAILPKVEDRVSQALEVEARRDLALAALAARDGGHAAAIAFLAARSDPFTGAPYAAEVGSDGFLRLASAGPDTVLAPGEWSATREEGVDDPRWLIAPEADGE